MTNQNTETPKDDAWYIKSPCCAKNVLKSALGTMFCSDCHTMLEWDEKYGKYIKTTYQINFFRQDSARDWDKISPDDKEKFGIFTIEDLWLHLRGELVGRRAAIATAGKRYLDSITAQGGVRGRK